MPMVLIHIVLSQSCNLAFSFMLIKQKSYTHCIYFNILKFWRATKMYIAAHCSIANTWSCVLIIVLKNTTALGLVWILALVFCPVVQTASLLFLSLVYSLLLFSLPISFWGKTPHFSPIALHGTFKVPSAKWSMHTFNSGHLWWSHPIHLVDRGHVLLNLSVAGRVGVAPAFEEFIV